MYLSPVKSRMIAKNMRGAGQNARSGAGIRPSAVM